jgi:hypothetical protein
LFIFPQVLLFNFSDEDFVAKVKRATMTMTITKMIMTVASCVFNDSNVAPVVSGWRSNCTVYCRR